MKMQIIENIAILHLPFGTSSGITRKLALICIVFENTEPIHAAKLYLNQSAVVLLTVANEQSLPNQSFTTEQSNADKHTRMIIFVVL